MVVLKDDAVQDAAERKLSLLWVLDKKETGNHFPESLYLDVVETFRPVSAIKRLLLFAFVQMKRHFVNQRPQGVVNCNGRNAFRTGSYHQVDFP